MSLTLIFIFSLLFLIIVFDIFIILKKGKQSSISAYIIRYSKLFPSIPFILGFVCGHLFWSMSEESVYDNVKCEKIKLESNGQ
jgi:hypothetical protein